MRVLKFILLISVCLLLGETTIGYATETEADTLYENAKSEFENIYDAEETLRFMEQYAELLGFSDDFDLLDDKGKCAEILFSMKELYNGEKDEWIRYCGTAIYIQSLNENKIENIFENEYSQLEVSEVKEFYQAGFVGQSFKEDMTRRLCLKDFSSYYGYMDELVNAFILSTVKYPDGYGYVREILLYFSDILSIQKKYITNAVCRAIAGNDYKSCSELIKSIKEYASSASSGGGSSGGGGGGGGAKVYIDIDYINELYLVNANGLNIGNCILFNCYNNDILVYTDIFVYDGRTSIPFSPNKRINYNYIKVMAWENVTSMIPVCDMVTYEI